MIIACYFAILHFPLLYRIACFLLLWAHLKVDTSNIPDNCEYLGGISIDFNTFNPPNAQQELTQLFRTIDANFGSFVPAQ